MDLLIAFRLVRISFGLLLLWGIFYLSFRQFFLDNLRQRLFAIRDELFDFAADGGIAFDHLAYRGLRDNINSLILFGDKLTFSRALFAALAAQPESAVVREYELWTKAVDELQPLARRVVINTHVQAQMAVIRYLFARSLLLYLLSWLIQLAALWISTARHFYRELLPTFAARLEKQAREEYRFAA